MPPHIHVQHGSQKAILTIHEGTVLAGHLPNGVLHAVRDWQWRHADELRENWELCQQARHPKKIAP